MFSINPQQVGKGYQGQSIDSVYLKGIIMSLATAGDLHRPFDCHHIRCLNIKYYSIQIYVLFSATYSPVLHSIFNGRFFSQSRSPSFSAEWDVFLPADVTYCSKVLLIQQMNQVKKEISKRSLPALIEGYSIHSVVGQGGQAIVYLGTKPEVNGLVSIKVYGRDNQSYLSYLRELNILNQLNHPNVIKIKSFHDSASLQYGDSRVQHKPIIVLQFAYYGDLCNLVRAKDHGLPLGVAKHIFIKILEGLHYLEENNISHRDIKLENILIDEQFNVKLIDFGISSKMSDVIGQSNPTRNYGSYYCYKAPETYKQSFNCQKVDIFSIGVLLFCMCVGRPPFEHAAYSNKQYEYIRAGKQEEFWKFQTQKYRRKGSHILADKQFRSLFMKMCSHDAALRPSCSELLQDQWLNTNVAALSQIRDLINEKFSSMLQDPKFEGYGLIQKVYNRLKPGNSQKIVVFQ